jgi:capsid protein
MIANMPPGRSITVVDPPPVRDYADYSRATLRTIATGLGISYEDLTGDYSEVNFSSARMARLRHWARVEDWRWRMLIPQFCDPVWAWAMEVAGIFGLASMPRATWTAPPMPMIEPDKEGLAYQRNIRTGIMTQSEAIRERGYDPKEFLREMAADNKLLDTLALVLDSDARKTTQAGQIQGQPGAALAPSEPPAQETPAAVTE